MRCGIWQGNAFSASPLPLVPRDLRTFAGVVVPKIHGTRRKIKTVGASARSVRKVRCRLVEETDRQRYVSGQCPTAARKACIGRGPAFCVLETTAVKRATIKSGDPRLSRSIIVTLSQTLNATAYAAKNDRIARLWKEKTHYRT